jgi:hypothetical protein
VTVASSSELQDGFVSGDMRNNCKLMSISHEQYQAILNGQHKGELTIMIDTSGWRQIFVRVDPAEFEQMVGQPVRFSIATIKVLSYADFVGVVASLGLSVPAFGTWSILLIPLIIIAWFLYRMHACRGAQSLVGVILLLLASLIVAVSAQNWSVWVRLFLICVALTLFSVRLLYVITSRFVFKLAETSYEFFKSWYWQPPNSLIPLLWTSPDVRNLTDI